MMIAHSIAVDYDARRWWAFILKATDSTLVIRDLVLQLLIGERFRVQEITIIDRF